MGRGAYDTTGTYPPKPKPPPKSREYSDRTSKLQARWEEMNRREKTDREFDTTTPRTDHQVKELKDKKSKEEHRRMQWDLNQESQSRATAAGSSTVAPKISKEPTAAKSKSRATAAGSSTVAPKTSKEPTAAKSKSRRGLAKVQELVTKPWTKAPEASGIGGHKEGEEKNGKKHDKKKKNGKKQEKMKNEKNLEKKENGKKQEKKNDEKNHEKKKNGKKLEKKKEREEHSTKRTHNSSLDHQSDLYLTPPNTETIA